LGSWVNGRGASRSEIAIDPCSVLSSGGRLLSGGADGNACLAVGVENPPTRHLQVPEHGEERVAHPEGGSQATLGAGLGREFTPPNTLPSIVTELCGDVGGDAARESQHAHSQHQHALDQGLSEHLTNAVGHVASIAGRPAIGGTEPDFLGSPSL